MRWCLSILLAFTGCAVSGTVSPPNDAVFVVARRFAPLAAGGGTIVTIRANGDVEVVVQREAARGCRLSREQLQTLEDAVSASEFNALPSTIANEFVRTDAATLRLTIVNASGERAVTLYDPQMVNSRHAETFMKVWQLVVRLSETCLAVPEGRGGASG